MQDFLLILTVLMALLSPSSESFNMSLLDETSSTFSVARIVIRISVPGSEVFIPRASQLRHTLGPPV